MADNQNENRYVDDKEFEPTVSYDDDGRVTQKQTYDRNGSPDRTYKYSYTGNGETVEQSFDSKTGELGHEEVFDKNGNTLKEIFRRDGQIRSAYTHQYNDDGSLAETVAYENDNGSLRVKSQFFVEKDNVGREVYTSRSFDESGKPVQIERGYKGQGKEGVFLSLSEGEKGFGARHDEFFKGKDSWKAEEYLTKYAEIKPVHAEDANKNVSEKVMEQDGSYHVVERTSDGAVLSDESFDKDGNMKAASYYENGVLDSKTIYNEDGSKHSFFYENDGSVRSEKFHSADGRSVSSIAHTSGMTTTELLDEQGRTTYSASYYNDGGKLYPWNEHSYEYDADGKKVADQGRSFGTAGEKGGKTSEELLASMQYKDEWLMKTFADRVSGRVTAEEAQKTSDVRPQSKDRQMADAQDKAKPAEKKTVQNDVKTPAPEQKPAARTATENLPSVRGNAMPEKTRAAENVGKEEALADSFVAFSKNRTRESAQQLFNSLRDMDLDFLRQGLTAEEMKEKMSAVMATAFDKGVAAGMNADALNKDIAAFSKQFEERLKNAAHGSEQPTATVTRLDDKANTAGVKGLENVEDAEYEDVTNDPAYANAGNMPAVRGNSMPERANADNKEAYAAALKEATGQDWEFKAGENSGLGVDHLRAPATPEMEAALKNAGIRYDIAEKDGKKLFTVETDKPLELTEEEKTRQEYADALKEATGQDWEFKAGENSGLGVDHLRAPATPEMEEALKNAGIRYGVAEKDGKKLFTVETDKPLELTEEEKTRQEYADALKEATGQDWEFKAGENSGLGVDHLRAPATPEMEEALKNAGIRYGVAEKDGKKLFTVETDKPLELTEEEKAQQKAKAAAKGKDGQQGGFGVDGYDDNANANSAKQQDSVSSEQLLAEMETVAAKINYHRNEQDEFCPYSRIKCASLIESTDKKNPFVQATLSPSGSTLINMPDKINLKFDTKINRKGEKNTQLTLEDCMAMVRMGMEKGWTSATLSGPPEFKKQMYLAMRAMGMEPVGYTPSPDLVKQGDAMFKSNAQNREHNASIDRRFPEMETARKAAGVEIDNIDKNLTNGFKDKGFGYEPKKPEDEKQSEQAPQQQEQASQQQEQAPQQQEQAPQQQEQAPQQQEQAPQQQEQAPQQQTQAPQQQEQAPQQQTQAPQQQEQAPQQQEQAPQQQTRAPLGLPNLQQQAAAQHDQPAPVAPRGEQKALPVLSPKLENKLTQVANQIAAKNPQIAGYLESNLGKPGQTPSTALQVVGNAANQTKALEVKSNSQNNANTTALSVIKRKGELDR